MLELVPVLCECGFRMQAQPADLGREAVCPQCGVRFLLWPAGEATTRTSATPWYLRVGSHEMGPFAPDDLRTFVAAGRIQRGTHVRKGDEGPWVPAENVRGLLDAPPLRPPPPPLKPPAPRAATPPPVPPAGRAQGVRPPPAHRAGRRGGRGMPRGERGGMAAQLARQPGIVLAMGIGLVVIVGLVITLATRDAGTPVTPSDADLVAGITARRQDPTGNEDAAGKGPDIVKPIRQAPPAELTTEQVAARAVPSVAVVLGRSGSGTGFLVAPNLVATNRHVIAQELIQHVRVKFPDAEKRLRGNYGVRLRYEDPDFDLAFLEVDIDLPELTLAPAHAFSRGQEITVIGSPGMGDGQILQNAISRGLLSTEVQFEGVAYYQLDVAINPGNSGGPVFDKRGHVIGVVTLKATNKDGLGFCLPLSSLRSALERARTVETQEKLSMRAQHRLCVTALGLLRSAYNYAQAGEVYVLAMEASMAKGEDLNLGLRVARALLRDRLSAMDSKVILELSDAGPQVLVDTSLSSDTRARFEGLLATYYAIKEHVEHPSGTFTEWKKKAENLQAACERVALEFKREEGIDVFEED